MKIFFVTITLLLVACARPDYLDPQQNTKQDSPEQSSNCDFIFANSQNCAQLEWTKGPQSPAESEFIVKLSLPLKNPSQTLSAVLWMPSMGHGSSPVKIEKIEEGVFRINKVFFIMPGDWEIRFYIKDTTTIFDQATVKLTL
ncbi:FixH family protein [Bdellovibrio svalbardensis]|uniref:FixH family protein n=1 Tax=Bdellovibrio svalbardensis TaxID=2972972 RepID=A0ABT6DHH2_9BACT|nr:FixH family protein [Bdellovibrio svalbardensis]MDG0816308.1 FixH family protein [Bdellovibrio svalbardensis]